MKEFFEQLLRGIPQSRRQDYINVIEKIKQVGKPLEHWREEDVDELLRSFNSISQSSIVKKYYLFIAIRKDYEQRYGLDLTFLERTSSWGEYINYDKLTAETIREDEIKYILESITFIHDGKEVNQRNKLLIQLAWEGLSSKEIHELKISDIFLDKDTLLLKLPHRVVSIKDPSIINNVSNVIQEEKSYFKRPDGVVIGTDLKKSEYLFKPVGTRGDAKSNRIKSLPVVFTTMRKRYIEHLPLNEKLNSNNRKFNLQKLSLESIRRSKIIYLLSNRKNKITYIQKMLGKSQQSDIFWLSKAAYKIYGKNILDSDNDDNFQSEVYINLDNYKILQAKPYKKPEKNEKMKSGIWDRDREIARGSLVIANFQCEYDSNHQFFISRYTERNFVEAHHLIPIQYQDLYEVSIDVTGNICALCPVCHKILHYGLPKDRITILRSLYNQRKHILSKFGIEVCFEDLKNYY